jgi:hypothetical protein
MEVASYHLFAADFFRMVRSTVTVTGESTLIAAVFPVPDNDDVKTVDISYFVVIWHIIRFCVQI